MKKTDGKIMKIHKNSINFMIRNKTVFNYVS